MAVDGSVPTRSLSLRGESGARDVAIHRISGNANEFACTITGSQWIATGFAFAMTKCVSTKSTDEHLKKKYTFFNELKQTKRFDRRNEQTHHLFHAIVNGQKP